MWPPPLLAILALLTLPFSATATTLLSERQAYALAGTGFDASTTKLGNAYNYWLKHPNGTFDLTRRDVLPVTRPITIPMFGRRAAITVEPTRTGLVIIDMQNFFLHPQLSPSAHAGRAAVPATADTVAAFRKHGMKILWTNWGLTTYDLLGMPPALKSSFTSNHSDRADDSFGSDMGTLTAQNGTTTIHAGPKLMRGAWNAEPWGPLRPLKDAGLAAGTDLLFHKNRLSGLWGPQTPLGLWLQENEMTTLFFGGVNADQCVWSTLIDAYFKGYDVVYVDDLSATTSPDYATEMTRYNANGDGFLANSTAIIAALG